MQFLSISDPQIWLLAGISVLVVFSILLILVAILNIFTIVAKKTTAKAKAVKNTIETSLDGDSWTKRASGTTTTIGYKRIVPLNGSTSTYSAVKAKYLRITIDDARGCPTLHTLSVF